MITSRPCPTASPSAEPIPEVAAPIVSISPQAAALFHEQGFLMIRGFFEPEVVREVRAETEALANETIERLGRAGKIADTCPGEPFETRLALVSQRAGGIDIGAVLRAELHRRGFFRLFFSRFLLDIVTGLIGPEVRLYPNYSIRPKLPDDEAMLVLWHQDAAYTASGAHGRDASADHDADVLRMVNVWTPLVPATVENGCMQFIPGTHKLGIVPHQWKTRYYLEIETAWVESRKAQIVDVEMNPGDVVLFSNMLFHQGLPNRTRGVRWSADWRYQDATQSTLRTEKGHLARSERRPDAVVRSADHWASLSFQ